MERPASCGRLMLKWPALLHKSPLLQQKWLKCHALPCECVCSASIPCSAACSGARCEKAISGIQNEVTDGDSWTLLYLAHPYVLCAAHRWLPVMAAIETFIALQNTPSIIFEAGGQASRRCSTSSRVFRPQRSEVRLQQNIVNLCQKQLTWQSSTITKRKIHVFCSSSSKHGKTWLFFCHVLTDFFLLLPFLWGSRKYLPGSSEVALFVFLIPPKVKIENCKQLLSPLTGHIICIIVFAYYK